MITLDNHDELSASRNVGLAKVSKWVNSKMPPKVRWMQYPLFQINQSTWLRRIAHKTEFEQMLQKLLDKLKWMLNCRYSRYMRLTASAKIREQQVTCTWVVTLCSIRPVLRCLSMTQNSLISWRSEWNRTVQAKRNKLMDNLQLSWARAN